MATLVSFIACSHMPGALIRRGAGSGKAGLPDRGAPAP